MKTTLYLAIASFVAVIILSGCAKDGGIGPQGPQGPQGNANVKGLNDSVVTWTYVSNLRQFTASINDADITQDIVNKGIVMAYIQINSSWWALPNTEGINSTTYGYNVGIVNFINSNTDGSVPNTPLNSSFRIVVISADASRAKPTVNLKNYNEVKTAFNLKD